MSELAAIIVAALIGSVVTLLVAGTVTFIKRRIKLTGPASEALEKVEAEMAKLARIVRCLFRIQKPQLEALSAILEASKGEINGNIDRALKSVKRAGKEFDDFKEDEVIGGCKE